MLTLKFARDLGMPCLGAATTISLLGSIINRYFELPQCTASWKQAIGEYIILIGRA